MRICLAYRHDPGPGQSARTAVLHPAATAKPCNRFHRGALV